MKLHTRIFSYIICIMVMAGLVFSAPCVFAEEQTDSTAVLPTAVSTENLQIEEKTEPTKASGESTDPLETESAVTYRLKVTQTEGGTVTAPSSVTAEEAKAGVTVTVTPDKGYGITSFLIDGKSNGSTAKGPVISGDSYLWTIYPNKDTKLKAKFHKCSDYVFIMLDAGHFGKVNQSPVMKSYYESKMTWPLHLYLKQELEEYKNVVVDTTRSSQAKDLDVYYRGTASKGYDLFLSLHSNATGSKTADYPLVITQKGNTKDALAVSLAQTIRSIMNTKQNYQIWQRLNKDKKTEYYGVLRGAKSVGTKGMIIEHSFHTNPTAVKWLSKDSNLKKLAEAEAADIAAYYGLKKIGNDIIRPSKPTVSISNISYNTVTLKWKKSIGATGYKIYRASSKNGTYKRIKTITKSTTLSYKNTGLTTGKTYYYKVRPYRKAESTTRYGSYSSVKSCKVLPAKPSISSTAGKRAITVRWNKISGASGYVLYRASKSNGNYKKVTSLKSSRSSYTNTGLKKGTRYYYKIRAYRTVNGKKIYSLYSGYTSKMTK